MKYVRLRMSSQERLHSPIYEALIETGAADTVRIRYGGVSGDGPRTYVCEVAGDVDTLETQFETTEGILEHDVLRCNGGYVLCYVSSEPNEHELRLREAFTDASLTTIPPVVLEADGGFVFRVIGRSADLQRAVADARELHPVDVERVGTYDRADERIAASLTSRQTDAIEAALSVGYYTVPREGTHGDVAEALDCAPSTASEHLRKADATLVRTAFERT